MSMVSTEQGRGGEGGKAGARTVGNYSAEQPVMPVRNGARSQASQSVLATLHAACRELVETIFPNSRVLREVQQGKQEATRYAEMLRFLGVLGSTEVAQASQSGQSDRGVTIAARLAQALLERHGQTAGQQVEAARQALERGLSDRAGSSTQGRGIIPRWSPEDRNRLIQLNADFRSATAAATQEVEQIQRLIEVEAQGLDQLFSCLISDVYKLRQPESGASGSTPAWLTKKREHISGILDACVHGTTDTIRELVDSSTSFEVQLPTLEREIEALRLTVGSLAVWVSHLNAIFLKIDACGRRLEFEALQAGSPRRYAFEQVVSKFRERAKHSEVVISDFIDAAFASDLSGETNLEKMNDLCLRLNGLEAEIASEVTRMKSRRDFLSMIDTVLPLEQIDVKNETHGRAINAVHMAYCRWAVRRWTKKLSNGGVTQCDPGQLVKLIFDRTTSGGPLDTCFIYEGKVVAGLANFLDKWPIEKNDYYDVDDWADALVRIIANK